MTLIKSLNPEEKETLEFKSGECAGHCGDEVFLKYFGIQCAAVASIKLPKDHKYKVEMIDVWEMTRETLIEEASGSTALKLPGKEGIAVWQRKLLRGGCQNYMRTMEFTIENIKAFEIGQEIEVTEGKLPSSYYYTMEHALGMSRNYKSTERLKTTKGKVVEIKRERRNFMSRY